jgi:hypothetical protein
VGVCAGGGRACEEEATEQRQEQTPPATPAPAGILSEEEFLEAAGLHGVTPEFEPEDFEDARIEMRAEKVADRRLSSANERIRTLEQQNAGVGLKDTIAKETQRSTKAFVEELAPNADWDLSTEEGLEAVQNEEDILGEIVAVHATLLKDATAEAVKLFDGNGAFKLDKTNKVHNWLVDTVAKYEEALDAKPDADKLDPKGRMFAPRSEYYAMSEAQQKRHWTMMREQVLWIIKDSVVTQAKAKRDREVAKIKKYSEAHGIDFDEESIVTRRKKAGEEGAETTARSQTPDKSRVEAEDDAPPSSGDESRIDTTVAGAKSKASSTAKVIMSRLFPRHTSKE